MSRQRHVLQPCGDCRRPLVDLVVDKKTGEKRCRCWGCGRTWTPDPPPITKAKETP